MKRKNREMRIRAGRALPPAWTIASWTRFGILCLILAATAIVSPAQDKQLSTGSVKFTDLVNVDCTDGCFPPYMAVIRGTDGNL